MFQDPEQGRAGLAQLVELLSAAVLANLGTANPLIEVGEVFRIPASAVKVEE